MSDASATHGLTEDQQAFFHEQGYLVLTDLLDDADLQPVIDEVAGEVDRRAWELYEKGELENLHEDEPFETRLARISDQNAAVARQIWNSALAGPSFLGLITNPKLLDVAESLCGEELIASSVYRLRPKLPNYEEGEVPWHQDAGYTEPFCDSATMLTMWIPLVDADEENGCVWAIPGVHREGRVLEHARRDGKPYLIIPSDTLPDREPVPCPVPKGGVLLLTNRTPHASFANRTDHVRWSFDLRYQSAALPTNAPITRLEGEIEGGDGETPPACFPPEADFLVRSRARPDEVIDDPETFYRIRKEHKSRGVTPRWKRVVSE